MSKEEINNLYTIGKKTRQKAQGECRVEAWAWFYTKNL